MAVVGEANIIVRAITTGFDTDLKRQLQQIGGNIGAAGRRPGESLGQAFTRGFNARTGNVFTKVADGLATMVPEAEEARLRFRSLVRTGYTLSTALGTLVGGISALVGGLVILVGALGRAAPAFAGIASAALQARLAFVFAGFALNGVSQAVSAAVKQNQGLGKTVRQIREEWQQLQFQAEGAAYSEERAAINLEKSLEALRASAELPVNSRARREAELAYKEADLAYRQAKDKTKDLNEELAKGPDALNRSTSDPYAGLTESQKAFAQFLVGLQPKIKTLRESVASGFLPLLQTQIQDLVDFYFPELDAAFKNLGSALGQGAINFTDNFLTEEAKSEVTTFFDNLNKNIPLIGEILGNLGEVLFKVFNDADGIGTKFLTWVNDTLKSWNTELDKVGLSQFFEDAYETGSDLFGIVGNIFNGLGDFFKVLSDSGAIETVLGYLDKITGRFAALGEDEVASALTGNLWSNIADNLEPVMDVLGDVVDLFLQMGADPAIGEAFKVLAGPENKENWGKVLDSFVGAGPALAELVVTIGEIMAGFADAEAPTAFFETINSLIKPLADFFKDPANKEFVDTIGKIFAQVTAFTFVLGGIAFAFKVMFGNIILMVGGIGKFFGFFTKGADGVSKFGILIQKIGNFFRPLVMLGAKVFGFLQGIGTAVRPFIKIFGQILLGAVRIIFLTFKNWFGYVIRMLPVIGTALLNIGKIIFGLLGPWGTVIAAVIAGLTWFFTQTEIGRELWAGFIGWLGDLWEGFINVLESVGNFFADLFNDPIATIQNLFTALINGIVSGWEGGLNLVIDGLNGLINGASGLLNMIPGVNIPMNVIPRVALPRIPELASGGVISPSAGGTLARVAEAGRPERVEPLDDRGLSKRDYALINALSRGGSGITVNVHPAPGMDERELAEVVSRRIASEIRRGII